MVELDAYSAVAGYVRLSRAEQKEVGTFEEKVERHRRILLRLAEVHRIPLSDEQIVVEIKSGEKLDSRPVMLDLLERARRGTLRTLVTMAVDRLTRSIVDQERIADAFFAGEVLLVSQDGKSLFDQNLDVTPFQLRALVGQWERDRFSLRRKVHNEERASRGQKSCGYAPYGYRWVKPALSEDGRSIVKPGHYEVIEAEYEVVEEIFRRIQAEGIGPIIRSLNERLKLTGHPLPPGHGRREDAANRWQISSVHRMLSNPHFCGFPAHRQAMQRGRGRTLLPQSEWVFSGEEQDYPHPLRGLEGWFELKSLLNSRRPQFGGTSTRGILTRLLLCSVGRPMHRGGSGAYMCDCKERGDAHPGMYLKSERAEAVALAVLQAAFAALPMDALPTVREAQDRKALSRDKATTLKLLAEQERLASELIKNASLLISLYGEDDFRSKAEANKKELDAGRTRLAEIDHLLAEPDLTEKKKLLERIAAIGDGDIRFGTARLWEVADLGQKRELLQHVVKALRLRPQEARHQHCREIEVELWPFYARHFIPPVYSVQMASAPLPTGQGDRLRCAHCGEVIRTSPSDRTGSQAFCNKHCYKTWRAKHANGPALVTVFCSHCGKERERRPAEAKRKKEHFCDRTCYRAWKRGKPAIKEKVEGQS